MRIYFIEVERSPLEPPTSDWFGPSKERFFCPSLALPNLAAHTPDGIEVKFIDEKVETLDPDDLPDVAAISYKTMSSAKAYKLADHYREEGVKVILGGIHATLMPDEAGLHADSVVTGEGEELWPIIVEDLRAGKLKPFYRSQRLVDITRLNPPRFDLIKSNKYFCHSVQTSRGCSLDCEFCPTREMFGGVFRTKPIKLILDDIEAALSIEKKHIFFSDDIFAAGNKEFTLKVLKELKGLKIEFIVTSDFLVLDKDVVVELARSGCKFMALNMPGTCSKKEADAVKMIQALGINVWGYFMFGFKFHEKDVFKKVCDFVGDTGIQNLSLTVMAPYPNTMAGRRLKSEGRILTEDWTLYDQAHVISKPEMMNVDDLREGYDWIKREIGHLTRVDLSERRPLWKRCISRALAETLAILPKKSKKN